MKFISLLILCLVLIFTSVTSYTSQDLEVEAERVKNSFTAESEDFPSADSYWLSPKYEAYNEASTYNVFFNLIKTKYPVDGISDIR